MIPPSPWDSGIVLVFPIKRLSRSIYYLLHLGQYVTAKIAFMKIVCAIVATAANLTVAGWT